MCPFNISVEEAGALTEQQAHALILNTRGEEWCFLHKAAYSEIRKERALIGKKLLVSIVETVSTCGGPEVLLEGRR